MDHAKRFDGEAVSFGGDSHAMPDLTASERPSAPCGIAVMAKASAPGRTKTRLVPPLTFDEAAALNTAFLKDVADNIMLATEDAGIAGYAAFGPPGSESFFAATLPASIGLIPAWFANFGDCLLHAIREIFARGHTAAVVLNSDSPTLPTALLVETAKVLARPGDRAVLGPSSDGGYYLFGLKAAHGRLFEDIAWSTERVAEQTRDRAREIALDVHLLPVWYDVDDIDSWRRLREELGRPEQLPRSSGGQQPHQARHTAALMNELRLHSDFRRRVERPTPLETVGA